MSKKTILISIGAILLISGLAVLALVLINGTPNTSEQPIQSTGPKPGDSVVVSNTPEYKACELFTTDAVKTVLGDKVTAIANGSRSGVIAPNYEVADSCDYTFTTNSTSDNKLSVQVYQYSASTDESKIEQYDETWRNINVVADPDYKKGFPAYYKSSDVNGNKIFQMFVLSGAKNIRFAITQPLSSQYFGDKEVIAMMIQFANQANYDVINPVSEDIPPAPNV